MSKASNADRETIACGLKPPELEEKSSPTLDELHKHYCEAKNLAISHLKEMIRLATRLKDGCGALDGLLEDEDKTNFSKAFTWLCRGGDWQYLQRLLVSGASNHQRCKLGKSCSYQMLLDVLTSCTTRLIPDGSSSRKKSKKQSANRIEVSISPLQTVHEIQFLRCLDLLKHAIGHIFRRMLPRQGDHVNLHGAVRHSPSGVTDEFRWLKEITTAMQDANLLDRCFITQTGEIVLQLTATCSENICTSTKQVLEHLLDENSSTLQTPPRQIRDEMSLQSTIEESSSSSAGMSADCMSSGVPHSQEATSVAEEVADEKSLKKLTREERDKRNRRIDEAIQSLEMPVKEDTKDMTEKSKISSGREATRSLGQDQNDPGKPTSVVLEYPSPSSLSADCESESTNQCYCLYCASEAADDRNIDKEEESLTVEDLIWEVDMTKEVRKQIQTEVKPMRRRVMDRIRRIASNDQCRNLRKLVCPEYGIYQAKVTKSARLIWQEVVSFSSRLSTTEKHIYTDKIRLWHLATDHKKLGQCIDRVKVSIKKGNECLADFKKKLRVTQPSEKDERGQRVPGLYEEGETGEGLVVYSPPASSRDEEFTSEKFYGVNTDFIDAILWNPEDVDFPFEVTGQEWKIIRLPSDAPILLLGRSGTGKTTCLLYRMWRNFISYREASLSVVAGTVPDDESTPALAEACAVADPLQHCQEEGALHQIFVTKNPVLCKKMKKNFQKLMGAKVELADHVERSKCALPARIQDIHDLCYPLFLTARQFLVLLDASLIDEQYFFARNDDGSLQYRQDEYTDHDGDAQFVSFLDGNDEVDNEDSDDNDEGDSDDNDDGGGGGDNNCANDRWRPGGETKDGDRRRDERRFEEENRRIQENQRTPKAARKIEITYSKFEREMWPKINKKNRKHGYPSVLVWREIKSFIKGSLDSLITGEGYLSGKEYYDIGRKQAPDFQGKREDIYRTFEEYRDELKRARAYDESDAVRNLFERLSKMAQTNPQTWRLDELYVDEVQDFTQAELALLTAACNRPNNAFFTGDTAQTIMRGVSFRFEDLQSLYHRRTTHPEQPLGFSLGDPRMARKPEKPYHLTENYRSHAGILSLAASVLDLLRMCFPESFDHRNVPKDQGRLAGPLPVLIRSGNAADIANSIGGSTHDTSAIEFGAHQAIIVQSEDAKERLPDELKKGVRLTIFEAKGLEFDDVLIYNFFHDSKASEDDWRTVTSVFKEMVMTSKDPVRIREVPDIYKPPRAAEFQPDTHRILCSELKFLYTAITRARTNVWIVDNGIVKCAPMFDYFHRRGLVLLQADTEGSTDVQVNLRKFAKTTSREEWIGQGQVYRKQRRWDQAITCFKNAGQQGHLLLIECEAMKLLHTESTQLEGDPEVFLTAADMFFTIRKPVEAAKCLRKAGEYRKAGLVLEKLGKSDKAIRTYKRWVKKSGAEHRNEAISILVNLYEHHNDWRRAVHFLYKNKRFAEAMSSIDRYEEVKHDRVTAKPPRQSERKEKIAFVETQFFLETCLREQADKLPERVDPYLLSFISVDEQVTLFVEKKWHDKAAQILCSNDRHMDAGELLYNNGILGKAIEILEQVKAWEATSLKAACVFLRARGKRGKRSYREFGQPNLEGDSSTAMPEPGQRQYLDSLNRIADECSSYDNAESADTKATAHLLLWELTTNQTMRLLETAYRQYIGAGNAIGEALALVHLLDSGQQLTTAMYTPCVRRLCDLLRTLADIQFDESLVGKCETLFGIRTLEPTVKCDEVVYLSDYNIRLWDIDSRDLRQHRDEGDFIKNTTLKKLRRSDVHTGISGFICKLICHFYKEEQATMNSCYPCPYYLLGITCKGHSCPYAHNNCFDWMKSVRHCCILLQLTSTTEKEMATDRKATGCLALELRTHLGNWKQDYHSRFEDIVVPNGLFPLPAVAFLRDTTINKQCQQELRRKQQQQQWLGLDQKERWHRLDKFFNLWLTQAVIGCSLRILARLLSKETAAYKSLLSDKEAKESGKPLPRDPSFLPKPYRKKDYTSFLQLWLDTLRDMYEKGNVIAALKSLTKLFNILSTEIVLIPPDAPTGLLLLELGLTLSALCLARSGKELVFIPSHFICQFKYIDALVGRQGIGSPHQGVESIVRDTVTQQSTGQLIEACKALVQSVCAVLLGRYRGSEDESYIQKIIYLEESKMQWITVKRCIILVLTVLSNRHYVHSSDIIDLLAAIEYIPQSESQGWLINLLKTFQMETNPTVTQFTVIGSLNELLKPLQMSAQLLTFNPQLQDPGHVFDLSELHGAAFGDPLPRSKTIHTFKTLQENITKRRATEEKSKHSGTTDEEGKESIPPNQAHSKRTKPLTSPHQLSGVSLISQESLSALKDDQSSQQSSDAGSEKKYRKTGISKERPIEEFIRRGTSDKKRKKGKRERQAEETQDEMSEVRKTSMKDRFSVSKSRCDICEVEFPSSRMYRDHIHSRSHKALNYHFEHFAMTHDEEAAPLLEETATFLSQLDYKSGSESLHKYQQKIVEKERDLKEFIGTVTRKNECNWKAGDKQIQYYISDLKKAIKKLQSQYVVKIETVQCYGTEVEQREEERDAGHYVRGSYSA